jgi:Tfp pilus assembly protein FimT
MINKKGFTLIEVLLIILLIAMLGVAALMAFFDTSDQFNFISEYKPIVSTMRKARSYAINNKNTEDIDRYGLEIKSNSIILFGDGKDSEPYSFDGDVVVETVTISDKYSLDFLNEHEHVVSVYLFYETGSADLAAYKTMGEDLIKMDKTDPDYKRLDFRFTDNDEFQKYIYIFQVSGIAEESLELLK